MGKTIFEYSAWQPMRVQKSTIFKNIAISIGGSTISGLLGSHLEMQKSASHNWYRDDF